MCVEALSGDDELAAGVGNGDPSLLVAGRDSFSDSAGVGEDTNPWHPSSGGGGA